MRLLVVVMLVLLSVSPAAATPAQLAVRAVSISPTMAIVTWEVVPDAVLTCVYTPQDSACMVGDAPPRLSMRMAWGEPAVVVARSELVVLAVGAAQAGPPPIYLPQILFFH